MSGNIVDQIKGAAPRNAALLETLRATDHAVAGLEQQNRYLGDLQRELARVQQAINNFDGQRKKELKDHEKYRDSVMRRFAYRVSGKTDEFMAKAEKEEKEYFDVLQQLHQHQNQRHDVEKMIAEATRVKVDLEDQSRVHQQAQSDLDGLYHSIFDGPSTGFPEEDSLEQTTKSAGQAYHQANMQADADKKAVNSLRDAWNRYNQAAASMEDALSYSRRDIMGGSSIYDMMERSALGQAQNSIMQGQMLVTQAMRFSADVRDVPPVHIDSGHMMSDMLFDNVFSDLAFHDKIKDSRAQLQNTMMALNGQIAAADGRAAASEQYMRMRWDELCRARAELQKARSAIFERVTAGQAGQGQNSPQPGPSISAQGPPMGGSSPRPPPKNDEAPPPYGPV